MRINIVHGFLVYRPFFVNFSARIFFAKKNQFFLGYMVFDFFVLKRLKLVLLLIS